MDYHLLVVAPVKLVDCTGSKGHGSDLFDAVVDLVTVPLDLAGGNV